MRGKQNNLPQLTMTRRYKKPYLGRRSKTSPKVLSSLVVCKLQIIFIHKIFNLFYSKIDSINVVIKNETMDFAILWVLYGVNTVEISNIQCKKNHDRFVDQIQFRYSPKSF